MMDSTNSGSKCVCRFDSFLLDTGERALFRDGERVQLTPKAVEMLIVLVGNAGLVVEKEELMEKVWPDTFVEEANLAVNISMLRKALGEMPGGGQYIETMPKRGYRFAGRVSPSTRANHEGSAAAGPAIDDAGAVESRSSAGEPGQRSVSEERTSDFGFANILKQPRWRTAIVVFSLAITGAAVAYFAFARRTDHAAQGQVKRLAVLPFRNLRASEETDYLGFALADSVINNLDYLQSLVVRPSSYVEKYVNQKKDPRDIARELDVNTLLTGSYLKDGEDLVVNAELADVGSGEKLWSESIRVNSSKLAELQDYVARQVVAGLRLNLTDAEGKRLARDKSGDPVAFEYLQRSGYLLSTNNHRKAIELLEKSVELDPNNALAWAFLGRAYQIDALQFSGDRSELSKAEAGYEQALALDPQLSQARLMMAKLFTETGRVERALPLLIELVRNNPNMAEARWELSYAYRYAGLLDESIAEGEQALQTNTKLESHQFNSYLYAGRYDKFLMSLPAKEDAYVVFYRGLVYYYLDDTGRAAAAFDRAYELNQSSVISLIGRALRLAIAGKNVEGLQVLRKAEALTLKPGTGDGEISFKFAQAYDVLGDRESALRAFERAVEQGFFCYSYFAVDPLLKNIRSEPAFAGVLEKARLRQEAVRQKLAAGE